MTGRSKILVLGATSLVGSHFVETRHGEGITAVDIEDPRKMGMTVEEYIPLDLSREKALRDMIRKTQCDAVVNFVARTDVDGCEKERPPDVSSPAKIGGARSAWHLNAELPGWLAQETARKGILLVHLSTDFVFDGTRGPYRENALPDPFGPLVSWYGYTKGVGESRVLSINSKGSAVIRLSYPYRSQFVGKLDLARNLVARHDQGKLYPLYSDQMITPTWIPDVTRAVESILATGSTGVYHVASPVVTTPYEFAMVLFTELGIDTEGVHSSRMDGAVVPGVAPRPHSGGLEIRGIRSLGVDPASYIEGIKMFVSEVRSKAQKAVP